MYGAFVCSNEIYIPEKYMNNKKYLLFIVNTKTNIINIYNTDIEDVYVLRIEINGISKKFLMEVSSVIQSVNIKSILYVTGSCIRNSSVCIYECYFDFNELTMNKSEFELKLQSLKNIERIYIEKCNNTYDGERLTSAYLTHDRNIPNYMMSNINEQKFIVIMKEKASKVFPIRNEDIYQLDILIDNIDRNFLRNISDSMNKFDVDIITSDGTCLPDNRDLYTCYFYRNNINIDKFVESLKFDNVDVVCKKVEDIT